MSSVPIRQVPTSEVGLRITPDRADELLPVVTSGPGTALVDQHAREVGGMEELSDELVPLHVVGEVLARVEEVGWMIGGASGSAERSFTSRDWSGVD